MQLPTARLWSTAKIIIKWRTVENKTRRHSEVTPKKTGICSTSASFPFESAIAGLRFQIGTQTQAYHSSPGRLPTQSRKSYVALLMRQKSTRAFYCLLKECSTDFQREHVHGKVELHPSESSARRVGCTNNRHPAAKPYWRAVATGSAV